MRPVASRESSPPSRGRWHFSVNGIDESSVPPNNALARRPVAAGRHFYPIFTTTFWCCYAER